MEENERQEENGQADDERSENVEEAENGSLYGEEYSYGVGLIVTDEEYYERVERHLEAFQTELVQSALNCVKEESGKKHFYQSKIYKQKQWYNEQRKQLKAALKAEPDNEEYKKELDELEAFRKTGEYKQYRRAHRRQEMGGVCGEACAEGCCMCSCEVCVQGCCEGLGGC